MNEPKIVKESVKKWYQRPFWLIGLGILALGTISDSASVGRFLVLIFITTGILFYLWLYFVTRTGFRRNQKNMFIRGMGGFSAFIISIIITIILFVVLVLSLNWIKCGGYQGDIFSGKCSRLKNTTSPTNSQKAGLDRY